MKEKKPVIGRIDKADFPVLGLENIDIKVDTGAFTSSIHCQDMEIEDNLLKCRFLDPEHPLYHQKEFVFENYDQKEVKSSNGQVEQRYRIETEIVLFDTTYPIFLTLTDRKAMKFPVLLGRNFLTKKFVVDSNRTNISYKMKSKQA